MTNVFHFVFGLSLVTWITGCESSPLGPAISDRDYDQGSTDADGGVTSQSQPSQSQTSVSQTQTNVGDGTTETCSRTSGHNVYYTSSSVSLVYDCVRDIELVTTTGMPSYLSSSISGTTVTFAGTPAATSSDSWSFAVNSNTTIGDAASVSTQVLDISSLTQSIESSPNVANNNDSVIDLSQSVTLDSTWDGSMSDVTLIANSISSDMHGLTRYSSCASATVPYVCNDTATTSSNAIDGGLLLRWQWSAFDQGTYYLTVSPQITIEGGSTSLSSSTATFTLPIQTSGNVTVAHGLAADSLKNATYNDTKYFYSAAVGTASTATTPVVGIVYAGQDTTISNFFNRITVDRTDDPTGGDDGVSEATSIQVSDDNISSNFQVRSLSSGSWVVGGIRQTTGSTNVYVNVVDNDSSTPAISAFAELTNFASSNDSVTDFDITSTFSDNTDSPAVTRLGIAYVRTNSVSNRDFLTVVKLDPTGTDLNSFLDDSDYHSNPIGYELDSGAANNDIDRVKIRWNEESGTGYFYIAYRQETDLKLTKIKSNHDGDYGADEGNTLSTGVFADAGTSNYQILDLAIGSVSGSVVVAVVYRDSSGNCYFRRFDSALASAGDALQLDSSTNCYFPTIHFNDSTDKFIVTYAMRDTNYLIKTTDVTIGSGSTDTASTAVTLVDTGSTLWPVKLTTAYYPIGYWVAVLWRTINSDDMKIHGFHVSGQ